MPGGSKFIRRRPHLVLTNISAPFIIRKDALPDIAATRLDRVVYYAHRLAWVWVHGRHPCGEIDHSNRNRADNRIANLREWLFEKRKMG